MTVLGLGSIGTALAEVLVAAGHRTTVWDGTPGAGEALAGKGAVAAGSAAEAVAASPLVVIRMTTYEVVREVLDSVTAGAFEGRGIVNLTPGSPLHARAAADWARRHGAGYLDGVITATSPPGIGNPGFPVLFSGSRAAFDKHREVLAALGEPVHLGTDTALASVYDTALLGLMWSTLAGWLHGAALVGADGPGGNETATAFTDVADRWLKTVGPLMRSYAEQVDSGQYQGDGITLRLHRSAMDLLVHASELRGVAPDLPELLRELTGRAIEAGHGDDGYARLVEVMRRNDRP
ncbi:NAD(P)-dependent oxidoreductase [Streptomyces sp. NPDC053079]|uniref:NAD(P)-dependent oxidoreductase n=1 Tax=Streptomyces sp. NPDC053079 TaxID=3365697 RepID=UPI0037D2547E